MKLKIFQCKSKYARLFRIFICAFALACVGALFCLDAHGAIAEGVIEELIKSAGLMMY